MKITIKAKPGSAKNEVIMIADDNYEVKVQASADKGKANKAILKLLSVYFKRPVSRINIISGETSRTKIIEIED